MLPDFLHFLSFFLLSGLLLRWLETNFPDQAWSKALMYIY